RAVIERRGAVTVAELLATVPGVAVSRSGGPGGTTSVFLRGASSSHTLVLVDGVRVNSTGSGAFDWADLTVDGVERIEVLRGPQSAIYGSEALGGVISIVSRRGGGETAGGVSAEAGGREWRRLAGRLAGGAGGWDWSVAASSQETDGLSHAPAARGNRERDPWENVTAAASLGRGWGGDGTARATVRWFDAASGLDDFVFPEGLVDDPNYSQERRGLVASVAVEKPVTARWTQRLRVGFADEETRTLDPDPEPAFHRGVFSGTTADAELAADLALPAGHALSVGYVFERRRGEQAAAFDARADLHSLYLEDRFAWRGLEVALGARHDDHSVFGGETTWRATGSWRLGGATRLHGTWGTGFKAPTFVDLYFPFFGNPELTPETSESWDLGVERSWRDGRLTADLTVFAGRYRDLVTFDTRTFLAANLARAEVEGIETAVEWRPGGVWGLAAAYTLTDSEDLDTGELLPRRPRHLASLSVDLAPAPRWTLAATLVAAADRIDSDGRRLDDTERLDGRIEYALTSRLGAYARVENLFDEDGEEVGGYAAAGATAVVGVRYGVR
ncbi:MAG TPA: TonB-dependent receptor, partial [Thermoanaerobaculia bacterium]|nr:TonB-dependent receptor [Thermoanaerobaculia bacterium]